jgi:HK97 gp10 family phage protein
MADGIRVLGVSQAVKNLQTLSTRLQSNIVRQATRAAVNTIASAVKAKTYGAGRQKQTGLLLRSQRVSVSKQQDEITGRLRMKKIDVSGKSRLARAVRKRRGIDPKGKGTQQAAFYWLFLEKGTKERTTRGGAKRGAVPASPWVNPTFDERADSAIEAFRKVLSERVTQECAQLPTGKGVAP